VAATGARRSVGAARRAPELKLIKGGKLDELPDVFTDCMACTWKPSGGATVHDLVDAHVAASGHCVVYRTACPDPIDKRRRR
jgi:hypothetical protein